MKVILLTALVLILVAPLSAQQSAPTSPRDCAFRGRIHDSAGAPIRRAFVLVFSENPKVNRPVSLDEHGKFDLKLEPGVYDFFLASSGFKPVAKIIDLRACKPVDLKLKLQIDSEHLED